MSRSVRNPERHRGAHVRAAVTGLLLLGALGGCTAGPLAGTGSRVAVAGGDFAMPVRDMLTRRYLTVVRQRFDFSCGSAALATLLTVHYGTPQSEEQVFLGMWRDGDRAQIQRFGFSLLDMKRFLAAHKVSADGYRVSLDDIARTGIPGIVLVTTDGYQHFVVLKGIAGNRVLLGDPALGLRSVDKRQFLKMWNGVFFAINDRPDLGRQAFGRPAEWALVAEPQLRHGSDPQSQQAVTLTAPAIGEM